MPRRILLLNTDLELGGTPTVVRELAIRLNDSPRTVVEVACLSKWGPVADQLRAAEIHVTALGARNFKDLWVVRQLVDLCRGRDYDTVFSFLVHSNAIAAAAKPALERVRFFQSIQTTQASPKWHWHVQRFVHYAAEKVIVPSESVAAVARDRAHVPEDKLIVIPNAIDADRFEPSPVPSTDARPYPIGFLGRLDPIKMVPDLVSAVASLGDLVHLHIFGAGDARPAIERTVRLLKMQRSVTLHGSIAEPWDALRQIGMLVLPSLSEGMPLVLIEAMAAGVPVLARDVPGVRDVITDGQTGVLVKSLLVPPLAEAIARLVNDRELRQGLIARAAEEVRARFTWPPVLEQYRRVLGLDPPG